MYVLGLWEDAHSRFYGNLTQKGSSQDLAWPGLEPFLLWGNNVNYPTTVPLYFRSCFDVMAPSLKTFSDLCITSVLYEHHIWSLLCCFTFSQFKDSPMIFQRPANVSLREPGQMWRKPRQCSQQCQSSHWPLSHHHNKSTWRQHVQFHSFRIP